MNPEKLLSEIPDSITIQNIEYKFHIMKSATTYFVCYKAVSYNAYIFFNQSIVFETAIHHLHKELFSRNIIKIKKK